MGLIMAFILCALLAPAGTAAGATTLQPQSSPVAEGTSDIPELFFRSADASANAYFDIELDAGSSTTLNVVLGNSGQQAVDVVTYAADGYTIQNGGFGLRDPDAEKTGVTLWVDYEDQLLTLEPDEQIERSFTVSVPQDTPAGQYMTGIAMATADPMKLNDEGAFQFSQVLRKVLAIRITVPGPIQPSFEIGDATVAQQEGAQVITASIENTGNVLVNPEGEIKVADAAGNTIITAPVSMGPVYAHDTTTLFIALSEPLPTGQYALSVALRDAKTGADAHVEGVDVQISSGTTQQAQFTFSQATATPNPSLDEIQFLDIDVTISNTGELLTNARVMLHAYKDGELVEDFGLATSLALPTGDTIVQNRYIPAGGWDAGTWTFTLSLESVDPSTNAAHVLTTIELGSPMVVP